MQTVSDTKLIIPAPQTVEDTQIRRNILEDLALKILYMESELTLTELGEKMRLGLGIVEDVFQREASIGSPSPTREGPERRSCFP